MSNQAVACKTVLGSTIAARYSDELKAGIAKLDRKPKLLGILANSDPAARTYAQFTSSTCKELGIEYELQEVDKQNLEESIMKANKDDSIDGILVYFPVFGPAHDQYIQQVVSQDKDVEGLNHLFIQNLYQNIRFLDDKKEQKSILPCTPLAVVKVLEYLGVYNPIIPYGNRLYGKTITVVNRSEIVGRPLAALLANDGAVVYSCDIDSVEKYTRGDGLSYIKHVVSKSDVTFKEACLMSDVVITGVPTLSYVFPIENVKYGAVCVNFSSHKNFGPEVKQRASLYVPMIGKVTIMMLVRNLLRLIENRKHRDINTK